MRQGPPLLQAAAVLAILLTGAAGSAVAQGCTQCRDNVQARPAREQKAYRGAIGLLAGTAVAICSGAVLVMRQQR